MEISSSKWLSELVMEAPSPMSQCQMTTSFDHSLDDFIFEPFSSQSYTCYPYLDFKSTPHETSHMVVATEKPAAKMLKTGSWNSCIKEETTQKASSSSSCNIISFGNSDSQPDHSQQLYGNLNGNIGKPKDEQMVLISQSSYENSYDALAKGKGAKRVNTTRDALQAQDHVLAERKRRERLAQRFIALSALIPGLKKIDKASILGDAIKYIKQLQEREKTLEKETKENYVESVVSAKRARLSGSDDTSSSDENFDRSSNQAVPEIEVRVSDKNVLIRIHCKKQNGLAMKTLSEIEKLHLTVINSSVMSFGYSSLDITIIAQMNVEYSITAKDLVEKIRSTFRSFM
ncbi:transcription factor bHLH25-like [Cornus florida]|uniref:transcription factor bHLH25-like n=1 Tax=Cornus florida TaxID=4283 RepID=UPI00289A4540|nr:transcription factor bHLH25-like [Cornus florida]